MMVNERLSAILRFLCHNEHFRIIYHAKITTQILNMCQHHFNMIFTCVEIKILLVGIYNPAPRSWGSVIPFTLSNNVMFRFINHACCNRIAMQVSQFCSIKEVVSNSMACSPSCQNLYSLFFTFVFPAKANLSSSHSLRLSRISLIVETTAFEVNFLKSRITSVSLMPSATEAIKCRWLGVKHQAYNTNPFCCWQ